MEPVAKRLGKNVQLLTGTWEFECRICEMARSQGAESHGNRRRWGKR